MMYLLSPGSFFTKQRQILLFHMGLQGRLFSIAEHIKNEAVHHLFDIIDVQNIEDASYKAEEA